jgi:hypothetical protein
LNVKQEKNLFESYFFSPFLSGTIFVTFSSDVGWDGAKYGLQNNRNIINYLCFFIFRGLLKLFLCSLWLRFEEFPGVDWQKMKQKRQSLTEIH